MNQLYIKNVSGGVFKVPFKLSAPYDVQAKVKGTVANGKRIFIPADVVPYIDMERLEQHMRYREIKVSKKKVRVPRVGIKPVKLDAKQVKKPKSGKADQAKVNKGLDKGDN